MIYLLDTDTLIMMIRGLKSARRPALRRRALAMIARAQQAQAAGDVVALSAITVSELEFGAQHSGNYEAEITAVRKLLTPFEIHAYDGETCPLEYGRIHQGLQSQGAAIGAMDLLIAAHALALGATLVSNNQSHFSRVAGLATENWFIG